MLVLKSESPEQTREFGARLGKKLKDNVVISLDGDLGAGKTHFIQGLALGLGVRDKVVSPTYTIICEYKGNIPLVHIDLYRLEGLQALEDLGLEEYFYDNVVTAIEWGLRARQILPEDFLSVCLTHPQDSTENVRLISIESIGSRYAGYVEELSRELGKHVYFRD